MKWYLWIPGLLVIALSAGCAQYVSSPDQGALGLPAGFVYVDQIVPGAQIDIRYYYDNNFVGRRVEGYEAPAAILTEEAAIALYEVDEELNEQGYSLKIFDGYRPQRAVDHFVEWSQDMTDQKMKSVYYPNVDKSELFKLGYLAMRSSHSRGSTVDVTIIGLQTKSELDMGTPFDYLDPQSGWSNSSISPEQRANRVLLRNIMQEHGFQPINQEWWHFTLTNEPFPNRYFDFIVQ